MSYEYIAHLWPEEWNRSFPALEYRSDWVPITNIFTSRCLLSRNRAFTLIVVKVEVDDVIKLLTKFANRRTEILLDGIDILIWCPDGIYCWSWAWPGSKQCVGTTRISSWTPSWSLPLTALYIVRVSSAKFSMISARPCVMN
jgi:hypothetical protein